MEAANKSEADLAKYGESKPMVPAKHPNDRVGMMGTMPNAPQKKLSPEELLAQAHAMLDATKSQSDASLAAGPSVSTDRDANGNRLPDWLTQYR